MKILHTADWHLGQRFNHKERQEEHQYALNWLLQTIIKEKIDALIVAGDIFDIGNPPNYSRRMYYQFLTDLRNTQCRHVVITGGNHDSPSMLNAPRELLLSLNVHVIGEATETIENQIIELVNEEGKLEMVVAAVPFLRDKDIRASVAGESSMERVERIKEGLRNHYQAVGKAVEKYEKLNIPLLTTGHLYAKGAQAGDRQDNIYLGDRENIDASEFPMIFDYVALGHLHRSQIVGQDYRVQYSGSLIPLSFSELEDKKVVKVIHFENRKMTEGVREIPVSQCRKIRKLEGSLEQVQQQLSKLAQSITEDELTAWVEVIVESDQVIPNLDALLKDYAKDFPLEILKTRNKRDHYSLDQQVLEVDLEALSPFDVFAKKCNSGGQAPEEAKELESSFKELYEWMMQREDET